MVWYKNDGGLYEGQTQQRSESEGLCGVEMLIGLCLKHLLTQFCLGKPKIVHRSRTSHTRIQGRLKIVCGTTNITKIVKDQCLLMLGWIHNIGIHDGSITTIISRGSGTQSQLFTFNNTVLYLHFMWLGFFPTMGSHSSPPFNTFMSAPKLQQSFCIRWARQRTSR